MTLFCRKSPLHDTFLYVKARFMALYLYLYLYAYRYKCNNVAKIILKYFTSFALCIVKSSIFV